MDGTDRRNQQGSAVVQSPLGLPLFHIEPVRSCSIACGSGERPKWGVVPRTEDGKKGKRGAISDLKFEISKGRSAERITQIPPPTLVGSSSE